MADVYLIRCNDSTLVEVSRSEAEDLQKIYPNMEVIIQHRLDTKRDDWDGTWSHNCGPDCSERTQLIYG